VVSTKRGKAIVDKVDIFRDVIYLRYVEDEEMECLSLKQINKLLRNQTAEA
jgi:hypothetical protein